MPTYIFKCQECKCREEVRMTFERHENCKDCFKCSKCGGKSIQEVAKIPFQLKGTGWFSEGSANTENVGTGYQVSQTELDKNLDYEKRAEDFANRQSERDYENSK